MVDQYGRAITYLRLSVTELCNLRCRYCMPENGICKKEHSEMLTQEEMIRAVRAAASLGICKLRITGGEPLVKKNILSICREAAKVPRIEDVCITTNGTLLTEFAKGLRTAGVRRVNISLDTMDAEKYRYITRRDNLEAALAGIEAAIAVGFEKIKINTVLIGGFNANEIPAMAELTRKYPVDVRFIELMPMYDGGEFGPSAYIPGAKVLEVLPDLVPVGKMQEMQSPEPAAGSAKVQPKPASGYGEGGVAQLYRLPGAMGNIGLINPLSRHFCGSCNRIRITADGKIKPCLHKETEYSLKGLTQEKMTERLREAILKKPEWHGELSAESRSQAGRNMNQIGG